MEKNSLHIGEALSKAEQKSILGGNHSQGTPCTQYWPGPLDPDGC